MAVRDCFIACGPLPLGRFADMASPAFDFGHLTPEERIQLTEDLWDSLEATQVPLTDADAGELERRRALHDADPILGRPWREVV